MQFPPAPEATRAQKVFRLQLPFILEDKKTATRHFKLESFAKLGPGLFMGRQVDAADLRADRVQRNDFTARFLDDVDAC